MKILYKLSNFLNFKNPFTVKAVLTSALFLSGSLLNGQLVYKFTNCGATGRLGPTQSQINAAYTGTELDGKVTSSSGIQFFIVPASGYYKINAVGAQGFNAQSGFTGGKGASMTGEFYLIGGAKLKIVVGQAGQGTIGSNGGGGGGSFVTYDDNTPLVIAGGGAGSRAAVSQNSCDGRTSKEGGQGVTSSTSACGPRSGGIEQGGAISTSWGSAGGGLKGDGANDGTWGNGGKAFINGAQGGQGGSCGAADGGFGCGGSGGGCNGGGGGGGYSGGDGNFMAGGGGSYNAGTNQSNIAGANTGHGRVEITVISVGLADIQPILIKPITQVPGTMCVRTKYEYEVTFQNNGPDDASFIDFEVSAPGQNKLEYKFFDIRDLTSGSSKTYRLPASEKISIGSTGMNGLTLKITRVWSDGDDTTNNSITTNYNVVSLPYGSNFTPDANFPGFIKVDAPTLVTHDKTYRYNFTAPTGYNNSDYGTTWSAGFYGLIDNEPLPNDRFNIVAPSGGNDGYITLNFKKEDIDKNVSFFFSIKEFMIGKCDSIISRELHIAPMPDVSYEDVGGCLGSELQFINNSSIASGSIVSTHWDFGDSTYSTLFSPQKTFNTKGLYNVKLVVTSDYGFSDSVIKPINVIETPVADFSYDNQCGLTPFKFINNSTLVSGTLSYQWDFGDGNNSTDKDPEHIYTAPGPYEVTLSAISDNGCHSEITKSVYNYPNPNVDFTVPAEVCQFSNFQTINNTSIAFSSWGSEWTFGDELNKTFVKSPTISLTSLGTQKVTLMVTTQFGCIDSISKTINVIEAPSINFTTSDVCSSSPIVFYSGISNQDSTIEFMWDIDDVLYSDRNPSVQFDTAGEYNMHLTVTYENGCSDSKSSSIRTGYRPKADFSIASSTCAGNLVGLSNNTSVEHGSYYSYWDMGDGNTYNNINTPAHIYTNTSPANYLITLVASSADGVCPDTISKIVNVGIIPSCNFSINHDWTYGQRGYTFDVPNIDADYKWYFGDGVVSNDKSPIHKYQNDGKFVVKLIITTKEGCQCESTLDNVVQNLDVKSDFVLSGFALYPNPSTGFITISNDQNIAIANISVSNVIGETLVNMTENNSNSEFSINLSEFANGVYMVKIITQDNRVFTHKVVISK
ncbi:MAG: PKD domain-containing protein [Bacteroidetes bacterium]|nr:PKD domain-containing protein [Bacteroidota bacterium]